MGQDDLMDALPESLSALHPLAALAWEAAQRAGRFLRDERPERLAVETKSTPQDAVSEMDRGAEERIIATILAARPDDGILGEEGGERVGTSGVRWIVDPLDGTVNYLYDQPNWAVSIAAEVHGAVEVGVVAAPVLDEHYVGIVDGGAWRVHGTQVSRLSRRTCPSLSMALIATGFGYDAIRRRAQGALVADVVGTVRDIRRHGAAALDLAWLAAGRLDGYYERGLQPWDLAAGALIAREAGARVQPLTPARGADGTLVAAVPEIFDDLTAVLREID